MDDLIFLPLNSALADRSLANDGLQDKNYRKRKEGIGSLARESYPHKVVMHHD
jgi:hypothetical protein